MGFLSDIGNYVQDFIGGAGTFLTGEKSKIEQDVRSVQLSNFLSQLLKQYQPYMTGEKQVPTYTGQMSAGLTPLQQKTISNISGYKPFLSDENIGNMTSALNKFISGEYMPATSDYMMKAYESGVEKPMIDTFKNTIVPSIGNQYAKQGLFYGSDKENAIDKETTSLMDAIAMGRSNVLNQANILGQSNILSAISSMGNIGTEKSKELLGLSTAGLQAGAAEQTSNQLALDKIYEQWLRNQPGTSPVDELLKRILTMSGGDTVVTPAGQGAAGPLATAYLAYAMA